MTILSLIQNYIVIGSLVISMLLSGCGKQNSEPENTNNIPNNMGNVMGNLYNLGNMVQDENYIYFIAWDNHSPIIIKSNFDGTQKETIYRGPAYNLNLMNGYIYFIDSNNNAIYKMDTNGQEKTLLYSGETLDLYLYCNKIYFLNMSDFYLYSMDLNGENVIKVSDEPIRSSGIYFSGNKIYYEPKIENVNDIYKIDLDGKNKELIYSTDYNKAIVQFFVYHDMIISLTPVGVYMINTLDGTEELIVKIHSLPPSTTNLLEDDFYYRDPGTRSFHKYNIKTKEDHVISKEKINFVHLLNNKIFYVTENDQYIVMDEDGKNSGIFWEE